MWYLYRRFQVVNQQLFRAPGNAGKLFRAPGNAGQCRALFYWLQ
ncbi:hypothetical protein LTSEUGA_0488 [Salmonella enterica subsp. enterica serovar Uganda str. R8-3404]|uniref:Uncharacterized protein n=1 Tax=Salmonella enterica subsp. enterica serovar Uganda str. R8-3404 TaxID=913083 RepID=A0A6C8H874_SALET|nr:hypothetical protein LTSEUGA_0488 [Salmonella enterica subsp. enterica serovar Uganda str. R8-3404]